VGRRSKVRVTMANAAEVKQEHVLSVFPLSGVKIAVGLVFTRWHECKRADAIDLVALGSR
jgi:hypothetical protein